MPIQLYACNDQRVHDLYETRRAHCSRKRFTTGTQRARNATPPARELYVRIPLALPCRARVLNRRRGVLPLSILGASDIICLKIDSILDMRPFAAAVRVQR